MMQIQLNDETILLKANGSLLDALQLKNDHGEVFAVAVNRCFVPRSQYANTLLNEGDIVETMTPMQGG